MKKIKKKISVSKIIGLNQEQQILTIGTWYLSLAVNVLTNTPKISHITKGYIFQIGSPWSDEKIW